VVGTTTATEVVTATENMAVVVVVVASATNTTTVPVTVVVTKVVTVTEMMMVAVVVAEIVAVAEMMMAVVVVAVAEVAVISQAFFFPPTAAPGRPQPALAERALHAQLVGRALLVAVLRTRIASTITLAKLNCSSGNA
jgi:hypothetical protein